MYQKILCLHFFMQYTELKIQNLLQLFNFLEEIRASNQNITSPTQDNKPRLSLSTVVFIIIAAILVCLLQIAAIIYWVTKKIVKELDSIRRPQNDDETSWELLENRRGKKIFP